MRVHQKHGILLCGIEGFKVYLKGDHYRICRGSKIFDVPKDVENIVSLYVNFKYQDPRDHLKIKRNFLKLMREAFKNGEDDRGSPQDLSTR